ncbi:MAG: hypothetical protein RLZZ106_1196 [Cyanobacteriota bacterium]|jgi:hydrogenase maturation protease
MPHTPPLLIALGNRLRSDDGAGVRLAEVLEAQASGLEVLICHQLTPDLAEPINRTSAVLFVDAWAAERQQPQLMPLEAASGGDPGGHALTPGGLLALCAALYGSCPPAWQLLIPGEQWQVGDQLSARTAAACRAALPLVLAWGARHA